MADCYVYYRLPEDSDPRRLEAAARTLVAAVEAATGVAGRVQCRLSPPVTWMEIYEQVAKPADFSRLLAELAHWHGLPEPRRMEWFTDL